MMKLRCGPMAASKRGMALVLVLWIVAALAIFANSLGGVVRREAAMASVVRGSAYGRGAGEAAIFRLLQKMALQPSDFAERKVEAVPWAGQMIEVEITPWSGLININAASQNLLAVVLSRVGVPQSEALAQALVETRQLVRAGPAGVAWEAPEDLLQVPGITYGIYAQIRPLIVADTGGRSGINLKAAPEPLLRLLEGAEDGAIRRNVTSTRYRLTARVIIEGQGAVLVIRDVDVSRTRQNSLPWVVLSASQVWAGRI